MTTKLLIIEDEPALQDTLEYNLTRQGYRTKVAGDGRGVIDIPREFIPYLTLEGRNLHKKHRLNQEMMRLRQLRRPYQPRHSEGAWLSDSAVLCGSRRPGKAA